MTILAKTKHIMSACKQGLLVMMTLGLFFYSNIVNSEAYSITLLSPSEGNIYKRFNDRFKSAIETLSREQNIKVDINWTGKIKKDQQHRVLVTVGSVAANQYAHSGLSTPVIHSLITSQSVESNYGGNLPANSHVIPSDFDPTYLLMLIKHSLPAAKKAGIVVGDIDQQVLSKMKQAASRLEVDLVLHKISHERELPAALESILQDIDVFIAVPDKMIHNRRTARSILLTTYKHDVPVVAYSASYINAGALTGLFSTPESIATETARLVINKLTNTYQKQCHERTTLLIKTNRHVSKLLGIEPIDENTVRNKLLEKIERCKQ